MPAFLAPLAAAAGSALSGIGGLSGAVGLAGAASGIAGTIAQMQGAQQQKKVGELERQAEATRQTQMNLDAMRRKREVIRAAQMNAAQNTATATAQGSGESSGLPGAIAATQDQAGVNTLGISQNQEIGNRMFDINAQKSTAMSNASFSSTLGAGLQSLGGALVKSAGTIGRVGTYVGSQV